MDQATEFIFAKKNTPNWGILVKLMGLFVAEPVVGRSHEPAKYRIYVLLLTKVDQATHDHGTNDKPSYLCGVGQIPMSKTFKHVLFPFHSKHTDPRAEPR